MSAVAVDLTTAEHRRMPQCLFKAQHKAAIQPDSFPNRTRNGLLSYKATHLELLLLSTLRHFYSLPLGSSSPYMRQTDL